MTLSDLERSDERNHFFRRILMTLVRSALSLYLQKCVARFVGDSWVSCSTRHCLLNCSSAVAAESCCHLAYGTRKPHELKLLASIFSWHYNLLQSTAAAAAAIGLCLTSLFSQITPGQVWTLNSLTKKNLLGLAMRARFLLTDRLSCPSCHPTNRVKVVVVVVVEEEEEEEEEFYLP